MRTLAAVTLLCLLLPAAAALAKGPTAKELAAARATAAQAAYAAARADWEAGRGAADAVYVWSVRWTASQIAAGGKPAQALGDHLARMKELETLAQQRVAQGLAPPLEATAAAYYRSEAEYWVKVKAMK